MTIDVSAFSFDAAALNLNVATDFCASIPAGLGGKDRLLAGVSDALQFPAYFGANWDALDECLRDLSWLPQRRIIILHLDLPALPATEAITYLELLTSCIRDWKPEDCHELLAVFPRMVRPVIEDLSARSAVAA